MFRYLIAQIDDLGDRIHPIVVLFARKQTSPAVLMRTPVFFCIILIPLILFSEICREQWASMAHHIGSFYICFVLLLPFIIGSSFIFNGRDQIEKIDPLLFITPLSERSVWIGLYFCGIVLIIDLYCAIELFFSILYTMKWVPLNFVLLYPLISLLAGILFQTIAMSICAAVKRRYQRVIAWLICFFSIWLALPLATHGNFFTMFSLFPRSLFSLPLLWTLFAVAVPAYFFAAWRLFDYNLARDKSIGWKLFVSCSVYLILTAALAALWFGLWYAFQP